jgi:hypothetical protein
MGILMKHTGGLTARFTRTQTRKGCLASKVLLRLGVLRKRSLGPVNGGVRQPVGKGKGFLVPMVRLLVEQAFGRESRGNITT